MGLYDSFAISEQGYNHIKIDKECQDASATYSDDNMSIIAVADGHGGDNYPRTARGADFAVLSAINAIKTFVNTLISENEVFDLGDSKDMQLSGLAKNILMNWHDYVDEDVRNNPFNEKDFSKVSDKYRKRYESGEHNSKAYGTTLIAVCITKEYWFGIQIGDGKCVAIDDEGRCLEPIPWDENCQSNVTTSICDADAFEEFRFYKSNIFPLAIFAGCDGIDDSYAGEEELYSFYNSVLYVFAEHGSEIGTKEVKEFLPNLSRKGSGDDVSVAGLIRSGINVNTIKRLKAQIEYNKALAKKTELDNECQVAEEKVNYINESLEKAKKNYDDALNKQVKAQSDYEKIAAERAIANKRLKQAEEVLSQIKGIKATEDIQTEIIVMNAESAQTEELKETPQNPND